MLTNFKKGGSYYGKQEKRNQKNIDQVSGGGDNLSRSDIDRQNCKIRDGATAFGVLAVTSKMPGNVGLGKTTKDVSKRTKQKLEEARDLTPLIIFTEI